MRAVAIPTFGGPEVLELVEDAPVARARRGPGARPASARAGINFADTHARENSYLAVLRAAADPRRRGRRARSTGSAWWRWSAPAATRSTRWRRREAVFPLPDGVSDAAALALVIQGLTRLAPAAHLGAAGRGRERRRARRRRRRRLARRPARQALRRRPRDRDRLDRGQARARARARRRRGGRRRTRRSSPAALREANGGAKVDIVLEMAGGRVFDQSLRALAPFGRLVTYGMASREPNRSRNGALMAPQPGRHRLLAHALLRPPGHDRRAAAGAVRARRRAASCASSRARSTGSREARRAHEDMQARRTSGKLVLDPSR